MVCDRLSTAKEGYYIMKQSRFSEADIFKILKEAESGISVPDLCRDHGISRASFYKWRSRYGGMEVSMIIARCSAYARINRCALFCLRAD